MGLSKGINPLVREAVKQGRLRFDQVMAFVEFKSGRSVSRQDQIGISNLLSELKTDLETQTKKEKRV